MKGTETKKGLYQGYPFVPPFEPLKYENLHWYVHPSGEWGCFIHNEYKKPMIVPRSLEEAPRMPSTHEEILNHNPVYASPIPLHRPNYPERYLPYMVWHVGETGMGRFEFIHRRFDETAGLIVKDYVYITKDGKVFKF